MNQKLNIKRAGIITEIRYIQQNNGGEREDYNDGTIAELKNLLKSWKEMLSK